MNEGIKTDLYQLTMAQGYFDNGTHERNAIFNLYFRKCPFGGNYSIASGLNTAINYLENFSFTTEDIKYLKSRIGNNGEPLFSEPFLNYLLNMDFSCDVSGVEEGSVVFANQPILKIEGPIYQCQLIETSLLHIMNFETLITTKAARVVKEANGDTVVELGYRRAQYPLLASRSAFLGGVHATSNVEAGMTFDMPIKGTMAHSWIMSFSDELTAFRAYAKSMPHNCIFLVDTYDTIQGVKNAIIVGEEMRKDGYEMIGIRLDSGDLAKLSIEARLLLDKANFKDAKIVASNDLDEFAIKELKHLGAKIDTWGIGTKLVTGGSQPALGGVYKLAAMEDEYGVYHYKMKLGSAVKESFPGNVQVKRIFKEGKHIGDYMYDTVRIAQQGLFFDVEADQWIDDHDLSTDTYYSEDLLVPIYFQGKLAYKPRKLAHSRALSIAEKAKFDFEDPKYSTGKILLENSYAEMRESIKRSGSQG